MNLNQLKYALAVATKGSFTAAADECCVTQPTLSNSILQLEDELGEPLFIRTTRKVTVTDFGNQLLPYITNVLNAQEALLKQASTVRFPETRLLRIGASPLINPELMSPILDSFRTSHPNIDLILREMNMRDLKRMLSDRQLDFVFGVSSMTEATWETAELYTEPLMYIPVDKERANEKGNDYVFFDSISNETFVMVPNACGLAETTRELFRRHRRKLKQYKGEALSYQVLTQWAELGIGSAILPKSKIPADKTRIFSIKDKANEVVEIHYQASWLAANISAPELVDFANHLSTLAPKIIKGLNS